MSETQPRIRSVSLNIRISEKERKAFKKAAKDSGVPLSTWIRLILRKKSGLKPVG